MPTLDMVIKKVEPFFALTIRTTVPNRTRLGEFGGEIKRKLEAADFPIRFPLPPNVPVINIFYGNEYLEENLDVEYCMPLDRSLATTIELDNGLTCAPREVPGMDMAACYVLKGSYDAVPITTHCCSAGSPNRATRSATKSATSTCATSCMVSRP